ncbi:uncharacterized protein LOC143274788 [Babylonia areolata]|uniref:uncharacterized protein LOC143274788 n=1 Tax=Babylonia areolata TaxID=304850 RepID=UPI003FD4BD68
MAIVTTSRDVQRPPRSSGYKCCQRFKGAVSLLPPGATPPQWGILWLIFISLFSSAFTLTFLFPFLPEMILTFGYSEEEKGTYVGLIASSVFAGRAVGSFFWGWLSDLKGRRVVLLVTVFFNGLFSFVFGFADSLPFAMALRFLAGLANGTVGVAKTVLYDVSDNTNQAFSMSVISIAWGSGLILGPTVGGYFAIPAKKYPGVFSTPGFFADFPFILPSACCLIVCGIVLVILFFKFQEPTLVLNTESEEAAPSLPAAEKEDDQHSGAAVGPAGEEDALHTAGIARPHNPLLDRLRSHSAFSVPSLPPKTFMSMETLHCEMELPYYYARQISLKSDTTLSREEKAVSKSMHNLGAATVPSAFREEEDDGLTPVTRRRSYSHGHQGGEENSFNGRPKVNHALSKVSADESVRVPMEAEFLSGESERNDAPAPAKDDEASVSLNCHGAGKNKVAVNVGREECRERDSCGKSRSARRSCWQSVRNSSLVQLLRQSAVRHSVALYTVMSFAVIGFEDVFTIFASTAKKYDGLAFSTDQIGIALGAVSIPLLFIQLKLYPLLVSKVGIKKAYLICVSFMSIPIQLMPMVHMLADNKVWLWVCLVALTLPLRVAANSCFTGSSLLINNSVTSDNAGKANGLGMTCTAIARTLAPTVGGAMFSWSLRMNKVIGHPFDVNLTFAFFGFVLFLNSIHCVFLPEHLDHQKK